MKTCENCQQEFECGAKDSSCWCFDMPKVKELPKQFKDCLCPKCLSDHNLKFMKPSKPKNLIEGEDYYMEGPMMVFTKKYHLKKGYCCQNACKHCPYY